MNPELTMLGMAFEQQKLEQLLSCGLRPEHIGMPSIRQAVEYLVQHRQEFGSLPTPSAFRRHCPGVVWETPPKGSTPESVADELISLSLDRQAHTQLELLRSKQLMTAQDVQEVVDNLRKLSSDHQKYQPVTAGSIVQLAEAWYKEGKLKKITGLPYPWAVLNTASRGIQSCDYILLYGRPKSGKTFQLLHILNHLIERRVEPGKVLFVSFEMDQQKLINRLSCIRACVSYKNFNEGCLDDEEYDKFYQALREIKQLEEKGIEIVFAGPAIMTGRRKKGFTILDVEQMARDLGVFCVFIDGLLHAGDSRTGKRSREWSTISNISSDVKQMALTLNVPVLATHQANREGEKETPVDSARDLAYADALGQDADLALRITKVRTGKEGATSLIIQPSVAREFDLLGFRVSGSFCSGFSQAEMDKVHVFTKHSDLTQALKKEVVDDPVSGARAIEKTSLAVVTAAGHKSRAS